MNDIAFNTTKLLNYEMRSGLFFVVGVVFLMVVYCLSFTRIGTRINNGFLFILLIFIGIVFAGGSNFIINKGVSSSVVYLDSDNVHEYSISTDDFNKIMKEKYNYRFDVQNEADSTVNMQYYTVTNLKNNEKYHRCYLDFEKVNNNMNKVKLADVTCGNSIMKEITKNNQ